MAVDGYVPLAVRINDRVVDLPFLITLYDLQGDDACGAITTASPLSVGTQGSLEFEGTHHGKTWSVVVGRITVTGQSAVGFEFKIDAPIQRTPIAAKARNEDAAR